MKKFPNFVFQILLFLASNSYLCAKFQDIHVVKKRQILIGSGFQLIYSF